MKKYISTFLGLQAFFVMNHLHADEAASSPTGGLSQTLMMIAIALLFFYFILWRPEQKRRKAMQKQRESMKKGDRVTAMGIIGTLIRIQENSIILKMYDGSKIEMLKAAITDVQPGSAEDAKRAEKEDVESKVEQSS
jgi:preprotein translocase subunit YajC